jgi:transcriptional regulator with XRE-family HTH domain
MNRAAARLKEILRKERGGQRRLALRLKVDDAAVSKWLAGKHAPDPKYRAAIEDEFGISWRLWDELPEAPKRRKRKAA